MIQQFYFWVYTYKIWKTVSKRYLYIRVHSSTIHNTQEVEITQTVSYWINKL